MKKINFLLVQLLLVFFVISVNAQDAIIQNAAGTTSVETGNDDIIRFKTGGTDVFQIKGKSIEPLNNGLSVFLGTNAGQSDDLTNNQGVFIGFNSGNNNTSGEQNVGLGINTLGSNTTGSFNMAVGANSMALNTSGTYNTALGLASLFNNSTGVRNLGLGANALKANTVGGNNVALGYNALLNNTGSDNVAIGSNSALFTTTGGGNIAIGRNSNLNNTTGSNNTIIGYLAGAGTAAHSKSNNVFIGYQAGYNETGSDLLYIDNSPTTDPLIYGNFATDQVGIGTSALPTDATYKFAVAGKMIAEEVRVLLQSGSGWPDYVFKSEYELKTLEEVDSYIQENGHLPNIPTAAEVKEEGILLGDMNKNLLEKIEELTLYMIQTNKDVKELQSENAKLKKEVEALKNK